MNRKNNIANWIPYLIVMLALISLFTIALSVLDNLDRATMRADNGIQILIMGITSTLSATLEEDPFFLGQFRSYTSSCLQSSH